jgi:hypothetical protein
MENVEAWERAIIKKKILINEVKWKKKCLQLIHHPHNPTYRDAERREFLVSVAVDQSFQKEGIFEEERGDCDRRKRLKEEESENLQNVNAPRNQGRVAGGVRINSIITTSLL